MTPLECAFKIIEEKNNAQSVGDVHTILVTSVNGDRGLRTTRYIFKERSYSVEEHVYNNLDDDISRYFVHG